MLQPTTPAGGCAAAGSPLQVIKAKSHSCLAIAVAALAAVEHRTGGQTTVLFQTAVTLAAGKPVQTHVPALHI